MRPPHPWHVIRQYGPALGLVLLAPMTAEYLLGHVALDEVAQLLVLAPLYGGGALVIREIARRWGHGWPTILLLGMAFGVVVAGLVDYSLFNPSYAEGWQQQRAQTYIPAPFDTSAGLLLLVTMQHAVWSIAVPIAIIETLSPARRTSCWLGSGSLAAVGVAFVVAAVFIRHGHARFQGFVASPSQMVVASCIASVLVVLAFVAGRRPWQRSERRPPRAWIVGMAAFVLSGVFWMAMWGWPPSWWDLGVRVLVLVVVVIVVATWARRTEWKASHRLALASGPLLTYAWFGFLMTPLFGSTGAGRLIGQSVLVIGAVALIVVAAQVGRRFPRT